jgi:hypothetical protein
MAFQKTMKKVARRVYAKGKRAFKKRYVSKGGPNVKNIYKDVMMLKSLVNVEKKRVDFFPALPVSFGQTAGAGLSGAYASNISPVIAQGLTNSTRNGNSLKLVSACVDIQFAQSVNTVNAIKIKYFIVCKPDSGTFSTAATVRSELWEPNPFSTVIDYHSNRDAEFFTSYRIIKSGSCTIPQDQIAAGIGFKQIKIPLKLNHHMKYNTDASTLSTKNQFYIFALADVGDVVALTGANISYNVRWYFTDN